MPVTAIIPLKELTHAKSRLEAVLGARRKAFVVWMLDRVLMACRDAASIGEVVVVAGDAEGTALAQRAGVRAFKQDQPGLNAAIAAADAVVAAADATVVVAADLPLLRAGDLDAFLQRVGAGRGIAVAATDDGGTAALLRRPPGVIPPAFGDHSAAAHQRLAAAVAEPFVLVREERLALDIDSPAALQRAAHLDPLVRAWLAGEDFGEHTDGAYAER